MTQKHMARRMVGVLIIVIFAVTLVIVRPESYEPAALPSSVGRSPSDTETMQPTAIVPARTSDVLQVLAVKGRAPKTGYTRSQFGDGWMKQGGCDMRNVILARDMTHVVVDAKCKVISGTLHDPYTGMTIAFVRGPSSSDDVQIDHVVALSNAWQTGAQQLETTVREQLANDPLMLLAVDGSANQAKGDGDAATWLPPLKSFRCQYVSRQIAIKQKYHLWVTEPEKSAMEDILRSCPDELLPTATLPVK